MTTPYYLESLDAFAPNLTAAPGRRVKAASVELEDGSHFDLGEEGTDMLTYLLSGLGAGLVAHIELDEELVTPDRAAELLGVSRPTIYTWQDTRRIGRVSQGSRRMVPLSEVRRLLESPVRAAAFAAAHEGDDSPLTAEEVSVLNAGPRRLAQ